LLNLPERSESDQSQVVHAVNKWLNAHTGWLLILDNADELEVINPFIPSTSAGHILLTTRAHATGSVAHPVEIKKMTLDEGTHLLLQRAKLMTGKNDGEQASTEDRLKASMISQLMDGLPLALDQAGAYIEETGCSFSTYLDLYHTRRAALLQRRGGFASDHPEPVATTWSLSFEKIKQANPAAAELLQLCAFLHPDAIPEDLLITGASVLGATLQPMLEDALALNDALGNLLRYSLVRRDTHSQVLIIHRLVQVVLRDQMGYDVRSRWIERVVMLLNRVFPDADFTAWERCQRYLPHVETCAVLIEQCNLINAEAAMLLKRAGSYLRKRSQFAESEPFLRQALLIQEQLTAPDHPETIEILNELALLSYAQGRYVDAETLHQRILTVYKAQESGQMGVAETLFNLAELYHSRGRYTEAETLLEEALAIYEQYREAQNVAIARCLNNLADLYYEQGRYQDSELLWLRTLTVLEPALGNEHPETAVCLDNLGVLYIYMARYSEAQRYLQQALTIRERVLGVEHRLTSTSLNNLAVLRQKQGRYAEAEAILLRALAIRERILGHEHPDTANILKNLALVYKDQGRYTEAEPLLLRTMSIYERHLGPKHLHTAAGMSSLALLYSAQESYEKAEPLFRQALVIYEEQTLSVHPRLALCLHNLAVLCKKQARYSEAEALFLRAIAVYKQALGEDHPDTIAVAEQYADLFRSAIP
jgi:tetratricopeptide (TPR) repeat protein